MSNDVLLVGAQQRANAVSLETWQQYGAAVAVKLDLESGSFETLLRYVSPPDCIPQTETSHQFKAATVENGHIFMCTNTEVLIRTFPNLAPVSRISLPFFNDVHHVRPHANGNLLVASTGLDAVMEITHQGELVQIWNTFGRDPWHRFQPTDDLRKIPSTKPHEVHPNFVFLRRKEIWVTRFKQRDVFRLCPSPASVPITLDANIHDGVWGPNGHLYVTTVDGHVCALDLDEGRQMATWDLNEHFGALRKSGWCRGLCFLPDGTALIGFSRIRPTLQMGNLSFLGTGIKALKALAHLPASVVHMDLNANRMIRRYPLEKGDLSAVFSLHPLP